MRLKLILSADSCINKILNKTQPKIQIQRRRFIIVVSLTSNDAALSFSLTLVDCDYSLRYLIK